MIQGLIRRFRNLLRIPGEDITLIGFDDRCKSFRIYDFWSKQGNKFDNKLENKAIEGNVAQPFLIYKRLKLPDIFTSWLHKDNPNIVEISFKIDKTKGCIFKTQDKPEGIAYLVDMQTGQGGQFIRKTEKGDDPKDEDWIYTVPKQINLIRDPVIDFLFSTNPFFWGSIMDSFIATELLRGKVEMWKFFLFGIVMLIFGIVIGKSWK